MAQPLESPPRSFGVIGGLFLIWNLMGVMAFVMQVTMSEEALAALPEAERNLYVTLPAWALGAFALAVFGGTIGCVLLLAKKAAAIPAFIASLVGVLVQMTHSFFVSDVLKVMGPGSVVMPIMVVVGAIFLVWYARSAKAKHWIG